MLRPMLNRRKIFIGILIAFGTSLGCSTGKPQGTLREPAMARRVYAMDQLIVSVIKAPYILSEDKERTSHAYCPDAVRVKYEKQKNQFMVSAQAGKGNLFKEAWRNKILILKLSHYFNGTSATSFDGGLERGFFINDNVDSSIPLPPDAELTQSAVKNQRVELYPTLIVLHLFGGLSCSYVENGTL